MTLIVTCVENNDENEGQRFIAVSDILISDNQDHPGDQNILPIQYGLIVGASATLGRRIASKAVLFGDYLLHFAGSVDTAIILIEILRENNPSNPSEFHELFDLAVQQGQELFAAKGWPVQGAQICAILNYYDGTGGWYTCRNAKFEDVGNTSIIVAGTGQEAFLEKHKSLYETRTTSIGTSVVQAVFSLLVDEITRREHQFDVYGGGYEIFEMKEGGGFRRIRYTLCEVSHYDHVNRLYVSPWFVSRIIKCSPMNGGSRFETLLLSNPKSHEPSDYRQFDAIELTRSDLSDLADEDNQDDRFGVCLVIDKYGVTKIDEFPFASFTVNGESVDLKFNDEEIQKVIDRYIEKNGADIEIKCEEDLNYLTCSKCGKKSSQMNFSTLNDEYGIPRRHLHLCDECK